MLRNQQYFFRSFKIFPAVIAPKISHSNPFSKSNYYSKYPFTFSANGPLSVALQSIEELSDRQPRASRHVEDIRVEVGGDCLPALDEAHLEALVVRGQPGAPLVAHERVLEVREVVQGLCLVVHSPQPVRMSRQQGQTLLQLRQIVFSSF